MRIGAEASSKLKRLPDCWNSQMSWRQSWKVLDPRLF